MQHPDEGTIHAWLDQALPPDESARLAAHVASCESCAAAVADARGLIAASSRILATLDDVPAGVIPGSQHAGGAADPLAVLRAHLGRERARERARGQWWRDSRVLAAAGVAFLAVGTATIVRHGGVPAAPMAPAAERAAPPTPAVADSAMTPSPLRFEGGAPTPAPRPSEPASGMSAAGAARSERSSAEAPAPPQGREEQPTAAKALAKVDSSARREAAAPDTTTSRTSALADAAQSERARQAPPRPQAPTQTQGLTPQQVLPLGTQQVQRPPAAAPPANESRARQMSVTSGAGVSNRATALDDAIIDAVRVLAGCYRLAPSPGGTTVPSFLPTQLVLDTTVIRVPGDSVVWFRARRAATSQDVAAPASQEELVWRPIEDARAQALVASMHDGARSAVRLAVQGNDLLAERAQATGRAALTRPVERDVPSRTAHVMALRLPCQR